MVRYQRNPPLDNQQLNELFAASWEGHNRKDFQPILKMSLGYIAAFHTDRLVGFLNIAWDGDEHAFILDTTVRPDFQRQSIGTELVREAVALCRGAGVTWLHVDYEQRLSAFYLTSCGFVPTAAGVMKLR